jgi:hypothetical protein
LSLTGYRVRAFTEQNAALSEMTEKLKDAATDPQQIIAELQRNLDEATAQQIATAEILKVIANSPTDVQPVFEAIVNSAARLFEPCAASIVTLRDQAMHWNASATLSAKSHRSCNRPQTL